MWDWAFYRAHGPMWYKYYAQFLSSPYFTRLISNTLIISILKIILQFFSARN